MWPVTWSGTPLCPHPPEPASGVRRTRAPAEETLFLPKYPCPVLTSVCGFLFVTVLIGLQPGWGCFLEPPPGLEPATRMAGTPPCMRPEDPPWGRRGRPVSPRYCPPRAHSVPSIPQPNTHQEAGRCPAQLLPDSPTPVLQAIPFLPLPDASPTTHPPDPQPRLVVVGGPWRLLRAFRSVLPPRLRPLHLPLHRTI